MVFQGTPCQFISLGQKKIHPKIQNIAFSKRWQLYNRMVSSLLEAVNPGPLFGSRPNMVDFVWPEKRPFLVLKYPNICDVTPQ